MALLHGQLRNLGPVISQDLLPNTSERNRGTCVRENGSRGFSINCEKDWAEEAGLGSLVCLLEIGIGNDTSAFDAAHLACCMFFVRDMIRDQAAMVAGPRRAHGERCGSFPRLFEAHRHLRDASISI